jgi:predicted NBD/HSP70 family sugar kinase
MKTLLTAPTTSIDVGDGTPAALRAQNRRRVLDALLARIDQGATQAELAEATGLSRPSIGSILKTFQPIMRDLDDTPPRRGAPRRRGRLGVTYGVDPAAAWTAAIDIGRNHVYVGATDLRGAGGEIRHKVDPAPSFEIRRAPLLALELAADVLNALLDEEPQLRLEDLAGLVLSLPGPVKANHPRDRVLEWGDHDVADAIREALRSSDARWREYDSPLEVIVDNDANLSAVAEHRWGAGRNKGNIFYVKWSTGLGGSLIMDGELRRGAGGGAGEFGHTPVPVGEADGVEECAVCHQPCFESAVGFKSLLESRGWTYRDVQKVAYDPRSPDYPELEAWIAPRADLLGLALVPVVNTVNPELLIVNGILDDKMEDLFTRRILRSLEENGAMAVAFSDLKVRGGRFTDSAAARGGLTLAFQQMAPGFLLEKAPEEKGSLG